MWLCSCVAHFPSRSFSQQTFAEHRSYAQKIARAITCTYFLHGFHLHFYLHIKPSCQSLFLPRRRPGNRVVHELVTMTDTGNQSEVPVTPQLRPGAVTSFRRLHLVGVVLEQHPSVWVPAFLLKLVTSQKSQAVIPGPADLGRYSCFGSRGDTTHPPGGHALPASSVGCLTLFKCVLPRSSSIVPRT